MVKKSVFVLATVAIASLALILLIVLFRGSVTKYEYEHRNVDQICLIELDPRSQADITFNRSKLAIDDGYSVQEVPIQLEGRRFKMRLNITASLSQARTITLNFGDHPLDPKLVFFKGCNESALDDLIFCPIQDGASDPQKVVMEHCKVSSSATE